MIVVLMGVAGSGKTTIGMALADRLDVPFLDADTLHSEEARAEMTRGEPITDAQREAWIGRVVAAITENPSVVLACSALVHAHRDQIRTADDVRMFLLDAPPHVLEERLKNRFGHFFAPTLLASQLSTLEYPDVDEHIAVIDANRSVEAIVDNIVTELERSAS
jgi:gluconokinase